jgi:hypothetical protein
MVESERPKKIRLGEAATAIGATYRAVRHWVERYGERGLEPSGPQAGTWIELMWGDVAALAITRYLVQFGWPAPVAFNGAKVIVKARWPSLLDTEHPRWSLDLQTTYVWLVLKRDGNWSVDTAPLFGFETKFPSDSRAHILLHVGSIVSDAFNALAEMGHVAPALDKAARPPDPPEPQWIKEFVEELRRALELELK